MNLSQLFYKLIIRFDYIKKISKTFFLFIKRTNFKLHIYAYFDSYFFFRFNLFHNI